MPINIVGGGPLALVSFLGTNTLKMFTGDTPPLDCCCPSCCNLTPETMPNLIATITSSCATINGAVITLDQPSDCSLGRSTGTPVEIGAGPCLTERLEICCDSDLWELITASGLASGCGFNVAWTLESTSCDPIELVFSGEIIELLGGTCTCCTEGDTITITITE